MKGRIKWQKRACLDLHCSPLWSPPEIDSWSQRAEVSPLYKMKSMSQVDRDDRKIYQGPSKINIWTGDTARAASRGGSLCIYSSWFLSAAGLKRAARVSHPAGLLREGWPDRQMRTQGMKGDWKENRHLGLVGRLPGDPGRSPGATRHSLQPWASVSPSER